MGTAWTDHVTKFFKEQKLNNPEYTFKQALKEAGKTFKKGQNAVVKGVKNTTNAAEGMAEGVIALASHPMTRKHRRRRGKSHKKSHGNQHKNNGKSNKKHHRKSHKKRRTQKKGRRY